MDEGIKKDWDLAREAGMPCAPCAPRGAGNGAGLNEEGSCVAASCLGFIQGLPNWPTRLFL